MNYCYSSELKAPKKMPEIDPLKPQMAGMLRFLALTHQKQTSVFQTPQGLSLKKIHFSSLDGTEIPCFVIEAEEDQKSAPGILMIHGGAFYTPVQTSALSLACAYAAGLGAKVFLPEYRLLPSFSAPKALEDCDALWQELFRSAEGFGLDAKRLLIFGDSAGAALATGLCLVLRDRKEVLPRGQVLIYPALDDRSERYLSYQECAEAPWSPEANRLMWAAYLKNAEPSTLPYLVPARSEDLRGLPESYVEPQEIDILRDEGIAFSEALKRDGVSVRLHVIKGSYHGFDSDLASPLVQEAVRSRIAAARAMLEAPPPMP